MLRAAGLRLVALAEHYGVPRDESVADEEWLHLAGSRGWIVFMKDSHVRYGRAERRAVQEHDGRCFCLSSQNLPGDAMASRFLDNLEAITAACAGEGPFIYAVQRNRVERLHIGDR